MLDALQLLTSKAVFGDHSRDFVVRIDADRFRAGRTHTLAAAGKRLADFVRAKGMHVSLPVMNAFDRYAVHQAVGKTRGLYSESQGEGIFRALTVGPRQARSADDESADSDA
jgi:spoIIIJ-associated protein